MKNLPVMLFCSLLSLLLLSCGGSGNGSESLLFPVTNEYALFFSLNKSDSSTEIKVINPVTKKILFSDNITEDETPQRVVCMSTGHVAYMTALGVTNRIVALSGGKYIYDKTIHERVERGEIADIGYEGSLNYELLIKINPDIIFTYGIEGENNSYIEKLRKLGFKVVVLGDYLENHPLGKLEYLKLFGAFFNCSDRADSIFREREERYLRLCQQVSDIASKPGVLLNAPWKEIWYIPGEENYMSVLIKDAGGKVILSRDGESVSHPYSIEDVVKEALKADFWLNPNNYNSIEELKKVNPMFKTLPVLKKGLVFNNNLRSTLSGGSDFWETGVTEPDVILEEIISVLHPEIIKKETLVYYRRL
ncbi:MAG: ABC transporter substrate-binding protein [Bacteroidales bacterium]|nr:ABC transporter substrate-binding protein [Bacteroidales bacterium]MDD2425318.1 ABC transporter substrate-binding protein [Bacteroidales bacterium]MDD3989380.1 ABC transporter substrate-binding protein [Bacteroidales bacterium]